MRFLILPLSGRHSGSANRCCADRLCNVAFQQLDASLFFCSKKMVVLFFECFA